VTVVRLLIIGALLAILWSLGAAARVPLATGSRLGPDVLRGADWRIDSRWRCVRSLIIAGAARGSSRTASPLTASHSQ